MLVNFVVFTVFVLLVCLYFISIGYLTASVLCSGEWITYNVTA
jgi:hypothetical protein